MGISPLETLCRLSASPVTFSTEISINVEDHLFEQTHWRYLPHNPFFSVGSSSTPSIKLLELLWVGENRLALSNIDELMCRYSNQAVLVMWKREVSEIGIHARSESLFERVVHETCRTKG